MAVAAPGAEPQTPVVPGRIFQRLISQPTKTAGHDGRAHDTEHQHPFLGDGGKDAERDGCRDEAAKHCLRRAEEGSRHAHLQLIDTRDNAADQRPDQHRRRQVDEFEQQGKYHRCCQ
jgi:hypothetical protein